MGYSLGDSIDDYIGLDYILLGLSIGLYCYLLLGDSIAYCIDSFFLLDNLSLGDSIAYSSLSLPFYYNIQ